ncbi:hypothetical protein WME95_31475 [Sorangium sp. So ce327]|jgi:hypothetical protein|uniref:hypothetical protein n=1 Tax=Sorangium sp. So ce327 TaxID=3133301 RepID=UPI003F62F53F
MALERRAARLVAAGATMLAMGCSGKWTAQESGAAMAGGAGGSEGTAQGGDPGSAEACAAGEARCNASGLRETCTSDGAWSVSDFVCARNVAVDDEVGSTCVTKADGSYRCWGDDPGGALPAERYRRVQLARQGLIGLTEDGRLLAAGTVLPDGLPPASTFRATNMWDYTGVCPLFVDGSFAVVLDGTSFNRPLPPDEDAVRRMEGSFTQAFCVFEGLAVGVRSDGSLWQSHGTETPPGEFTEVAFSNRIFCALTKAGGIRCFEPNFACSRTGIVDCAGPEYPEFSGGPYRSITATDGAVCAIDAEGALTCRRYDGADMPIDAGRFTFIEGGNSVLCGVRTDGSAACFRHGGWSLDEVGQFVPAALDPGW